MIKRTFCLLLCACLLLSTGALAAPAAGEMHISEAGVEFIKSFEGFSPTVHEDTTGWAIGYGTQCGEFDYPLGITEEQGEELMRADLASMEASLNASLASMGITLEQHEYDALVSFTYNLGIGWLGSDYQIYAMLSSGHGGYSDDAVVNIFARYCHVGSEISDGLLQRRLAEAKLFLYGDYRFGGTPAYEYSYSTTADGDYRLLEPTGELTASPFNDLDYNAWYYKYVAPLAWFGFIEGRGAGVFEPNGAVTNGEALKLILLAAGYGEQPPTDYRWASGYLAFAVDYAIVGPDEIVELDLPVSRALVAKMVCRSLGIAPTGASPFYDTDDPYVTALYEYGLVQGSYDGGILVYRPYNSITRAELAAIVWRMYCL